MTGRKLIPDSAIDNRDVGVLIQKGIQELSKLQDKKKDVVVYSTQRALMLRNGKNGIMGTGEVMRLSGREKLLILARSEMEQEKEDRITRAHEVKINNSSKTSFCLEMIKRIAQTQMDAGIDLVNALHRGSECYETIQQEVKAFCPYGTSISFQPPGFIAEQFGIYVHNTHMLASAWVIVYESINKMEEMGLMDREVYDQLKRSAKLRQIYLLTHDLIRKIIGLIQQRLQNIVRNTEYFRKYFKGCDKTKDQYEFQETETLKLYSSFLDSTIIELCFPGSAFNYQALLKVLHMIEYQDRSKELKQCPQIMWDTIGDLAEAVGFLDLFETPLLNLKGEVEVDPNLVLIGEFKAWEEAQPVSIRAIMQISCYVNLVNPLENLMKKTQLRKIWDNLNSNYIQESGQSIDELWLLDNVRHRIPYFSTLSIPPALLNDPLNKAEERPRETQASEEEDSDSSMPDLIAASDVDDMGGGNDDVHWSDTDDDEDDITGEDEITKKLTNLYNTALELFKRLNSRSIEAGGYSSEEKENPLLELLISLEGRSITSNPVFRTDGVRTKVSKPGIKKKVRSKVKPGDPPQRKSTEGTTSVTNGPVKPGYEDADDEGDNDERQQQGDKKKKKKKKPKKNSSNMESSTNGVASTSEVSAPVSPIFDQVREPSTPVTPITPAQMSQNVSPSISSRLGGVTAGQSTVSLSLPVEKKAESAHSYISKKGENKTKVKTRPDQATDEAKIPKEPSLKTRILGVFGSRDREIKEVEDAKKSKFSFLSLVNLKKSKDIASKLFASSPVDKKGSIKWDQFVQIMKELGFTYDPSFAGSRVRFHPADKNARSVNFHKPHPGTRLHQNMLKHIRNTLNEYYGLSSEKFEKAMELSMSFEDAEIDPELEG